MRIVTAGVIERDGSYLIAKRQEGGPLYGKWEFPGGKVEWGEEETAGLVRELQEELGVTVEVGPFLCSTRFTHFGHEFELHAYFVRLTDGPPAALEHAELRWARPEDFSRYDFADSDKAIVAALSGNKSSSLGAGNQPIIT